ncbi:MAG: hypothetical protein ACJ8KU_06440 [Chthoniobacterales bacterium]
MEPEPRHQLVGDCRAVMRRQPRLEKQQAVTIARAKQSQPEHLRLRPAKHSLRLRPLAVRIGVEATSHLRLTAARAVIRRLGRQAHREPAVIRRLGRQAHREPVVIRRLGQQVHREPAVIRRLGRQVHREPVEHPRARRNRSAAAR